jgi:hypothetical protein
LSHDAAAAHLALGWHTNKALALVCEGDNGGGGALTLSVLNDLGSLQAGNIGFRIAGHCTREHGICKPQDALVSADRSHEATTQGFQAY